MTRQTGIGAGSIHRRLFGRLALAGVGMALLLGAIAIAIELERVDRIVVDLTVAEANRFLRSEREARTPDRGGEALEARLARFIESRPSAVDGHFVETEIYGPAGEKLAEAAVASSAWQRASATLTHTLPDGGYWYRKHLVGTQLFVQAVVPYEDRGQRGHFEGVFEVAPARMAEMLRASLIAVAGVVLAALATTGALYPVIVRMNRALAVHAEGLERALHEARSANSATRAKSRFLATMSHELRTPLHGVIGALELLDRMRDLPPAAARLVAIAQGTSAQLLSVIGDVLDFSKIEADRVEIDCVPFDVRATLAAHAETFRAAAVAKGIGFEIEISDGMPEAVAGDPPRLSQILGNLISNAIKFTQAGCVKVAIGTELSAGGTQHLVLAVTDTGKGIDPGDIGRIFEPYSQADAGDAPRSGGTGLGLPISRQLAERMGGTLDVQSKPGAGSTFVARIPVAAAPAVSGSSNAAGPAGARGLRILVADDNPVNREIVAGQLAQLGAKAILANDGREAVALFACGAYDLVLLDGQMPEMDGAEAAAAMRGLESGGTRRTPIIALTASADPVEVARYRAAGMDDVVMKPATIARLSAAIRAAQDNAGPVAVDFGFLAASLGDLDAPWVADTMRTFADQVRPQLDAIRIAARDGKPASAAEAAHSALGAARSAGARELGHCLEAAERAIRADDAVALGAASAACERALERAHKEIESRWKAER
ncbi:MAG: response regulator [Rhodospirillales bacterium]|nr:response regulator [Rhodospirillales bacterium]